MAGDYRLRASATRTLFDGYARVYTEGQDDSAEEAERSLPPLAEGDVTSIVEVTPNQHFTEPPPRFTEATLIKALEEHGIGRPSTYAATISTIVERGYVRVEQRRLHPELAAYFVTDYLVASFSDYVDVGFTARHGGGPRQGRQRRARVGAAAARVLPAAQDAGRRATRAIRPVTEPTDEMCSLGHPMVIRLGRNGAFMACSTFPEHKETRPLPGDETPKLEGEGDPCPQCGEGILATKRGRFGAFLGCSRYPDCTYIRKDGPPPPDQLPFEVTCPKNGDGKLVARRARKTGNVFWGCSNYPNCDFTTNHEPTGAIHDAHDDGKGAVARRRRGRPVPDLRRDGGAARGRPGRPAAAGWPARSRRPCSVRRGPAAGVVAGSARRGGGARRGTRSQGASRSGAGTRRAAE